MCGICGFVGTPDAAVLDRMATTLRHRGPDDDGLFFEGSVALAHRRLSIVDLTGGRQPIANADGSVVLVFNGEIYNHPALRTHFESQGRRYATRTDSESILHAYDVYGRNCLEHLDGMFAFVLYDRRRQRLFGARDRMGKKPLYYTARPFGSVRFAFASELKALRAHPAVAAQWRLSESALVSYLLNDCVQGAQSIVDGVHRLEPGHAFEIGLNDGPNAGFRQWRYWRYPEPGENSGPTESMATVEARLLELLDAAVKRRLMADVPVGVLLSGGLDSSTIVALLHRAGRSPFKTFSIGFRDRSFDESGHAESVARRFGAEHYAQTFEARDLVRQIAVVAEMWDEPLADPSALPTLMLSELAAKHVKVALGGDGADELFAGYDPFTALTAARWYQRCVPPFVHESFVVQLARWLPQTADNMSLGFKAARFLRGALAPRRRRVSTWMGAFSPEQLLRLIPDLGASYSPPAWLGGGGETGSANDRASPHDVDLALRFYQQCYLPDDILVKIDRASMFHSLEVRTPFLDTALVEYVNGLPHQLKYRAGVTKWILKRAVRNSGLLPSECIRRRKKGFGIPVARWMRTELRDYFRQALVEDWPTSLGMFDPAAIRTLWKQHTTGAANHYKELWALFMLAQWAHNHLDKPMNSLPHLLPRREVVAALP